MRLCRDCYHDGCCEGLPYCGGTYFLSARVECEGCGKVVLREDVDEDGLCADCAEEKGDEE